MRLLHNVKATILNELVIFCTTKCSQNRRCQLDDCEFQSLLNFVNLKWQKCVLRPRLNVGTFLRDDRKQGMLLNETWFYVFNY